MAISGHQMWIDGSILLNPSVNIATPRATRLGERDAGRQYCRVARSDKTYSLCAWYLVPLETTRVPRPYTEQHRACSVRVPRYLDSPSGKLRTVH